MVRNKTASAVLLASSALLVGGGAITAGWAGQPPSTARVLMATPFDKDTSGWITFGEKAKTAVEADTVTGKNALRFDYAVEKSNISALVLPANPSELAGARAFRFAIKTDYPTTVAVALQEVDANKEEGRYLAVFHSPGGVWQEVALSPTDFVQDKETAAKDTNNKLDLEKVSGVVVSDLLQILAQAGDSAVSELLGIKKGNHQLWMRDFRITTEQLPGAPFLTPSDPRLDTFSHPQIGWVGIGGMKLSYHNGRPINGRGVKANYPYGPGKIAGMARMIPVGRLTGKKSLDLSLASAKPLTVIVQVEERGGGKYNATVELPGESQAKELSLPFDTFIQSDDSNDPNQKLDMEKVETITVIDASGLIGLAKEEAENSLYVSGLRAK